MPYRMLSLISLLVCLVLLPAIVSAEESSFTRQMNIVYAEDHGVGLLMDVFVPKDKSNGRGIIEVASGAWHSDRRKLNDVEKAQFFQIMCAKGFTVFAVRPGSITKFSAPEMLNNVKAGIRWVKEHAAEYKIDPNQLGMMGASAGGHLASLAMVTADEATRVKAVAVFFPPTDFLDWGGIRFDQMPGDIGQRAKALAFPPGESQGKKPEQLTAALTAISPARLVKPGLPPFLTIHGDADPLVPLQQSQKFVAELKAKGNSAELIVKPGGVHPWKTIPEEVAVMANWLTRQLVER